MKDAHLWQPSKFVHTDRGFVASSDSSQVNIRSRLICDLAAKSYKNAIEKHARGALLDVGCGKVPLYEIYRDLVDEVICVDWGNTQHPSPHLDYEVDLNKEIPLADERFDTILATDVLEHLANPGLFWSEAARMLRIGGKIIVGVPFLYWLHERPHDHYRYTEHRLIGFCKENGLEVLHLESYGGPLAVLLDMIGKNIARRRLAIAFQIGARTLVRSAIGKRIDRRWRYRERFPLGYCLVAQKTD